MKVFAKRHTKDSAMVELYSKSDNDTILWCIVHIDCFYDDWRIRDRIKDGHEIELNIELNDGRYF